MKDIVVSFTFTLTLEQTDVHWLEEQLLAQREHAALVVLRKAVAAIAAEVESNPAACPKCGKPMIRRGRVSRRVETLLGVLTVERVRLRCLECHEDQYPLDDAMGLAPRMESTVGVRERALWTAVELSYEKSEAFLYKFTGLTVSHGMLHRWAREEGEWLLAHDEAHRAAVFAPGASVPTVAAPSPVVYVQVDGTGVHERGRPHGMECKVGVIFSKRVTISKGRVELLDKHRYAAFSTAQNFGEQFYLECARYGLHGARVVFVGDGAHWIQHLQQWHFPDALYVLDLWHLERKVQQVFGEDAAPLVATCVGCARVGDSRGLLRTLFDERRHARTTERRMAISDLIRYVVLNRNGIEHIPRAEAMGSGAVEKQVDVIVARRLKRRGMSWYRRGSAALLRLRLLKLNGEWDSYWDQRRKQFARLAA